MSFLVDIHKGCALFYLGKGNYSGREVKTKMYSTPASPNAFMAHFAPYSQNGEKAWN